jgi:tRNA A-37 threonylcarbamoyl transferase component Bud32
MPLDPASSFCSKCGATAELMGAGGDELHDSLQALFGRELEIQGELGRGGMAAVYSAFDPVLQRRVAVKVLLPDMAAEPGMATKFLQEARTVASLQHPHVVTVYGVRANDVTQAIVMQFVEGRSLDTVLKGKPRLPIPVAALILSQAASGLQHAHDRGIIHRDVKPANVLLDHDGRAIVSDFGIARRDSAPRTTETGFVIGTWSYMSPEQRTAQAVNAATDQYAFGVMAFEILTGELPFLGTIQEVLVAHLDEPPPSLRERRPEIPQSIEALVHRMMAKKPADRFPSLRDAERAFHALVPDEGGTTQMIASYSHVQSAAGSAVFVAPTAPISRSASAIPPTSHAAAAAPPSQSRVPIAIAVGAVLLVTGGLLWQRMHAAPVPTAPLAAAAPPAGAPPAGAPAASAAVAPASTPAEKPAATSTRAAQSPSGATQPQPATTEAAAPAPVAAPRADSSPSRAAPSAPPSPDAPAFTATIADARKIGRDFVTILNQHRYRELAQLPAMGGDGALRTELIGLVQNGRDFAAGFDRIASAPDRTNDGFVTDFVLDLEWQGGQKLLTVKAFATQQAGNWRLAGFAVEATR